MQRGSGQRALVIGANSSARSTIDKADDSKKWQEVKHRVFQGEQADTIEHAHPYGFTAVPKPPDSSGTAEAIVIYVGGDRSHGVAIVVGDRRYRLTNLVEGEMAIHDDQGQMVHIKRGGIDIISMGTVNLTASGAVTVTAASVAINGNVDING
jgi:phage baseplate assembly protein V